MFMRDLRAIFNSVYMLLDINCWRMRWYYLGYMLLHEKMQQARCHHPTQRPRIVLGLANAIWSEWIYHFLVRDSF